MRPPLIVYALSILATRSAMAEERPILRFMQRDPKTPNPIGPATQSTTTRSLTTSFEGYTNDTTSLTTSASTSLSTTLSDTTTSIVPFITVTSTVSSQCLGTVTYEDDAPITEYSTITQGYNTTISVDNASLTVLLDIPPTPCLQTTGSEVTGTGYLPGPTSIASCVDDYCLGGGAGEEPGSPNPATSYTLTPAVATAPATTTIIVTKKTPQVVIGSTSAPPVFKPTTTSTPTATSSLSVPVKGATTGETSPGSEGSSGSGSSSSSGSFSGSSGSESSSSSGTSGGSSGSESSSSSGTSGGSSGSESSGSSGSSGGSSEGSSSGASTSGETPSSGASSSTSSSGSTDGSGLNFGSGSTSEGGSGSGSGSVASSGSTPSDSSSGSSPDSEAQSSGSQSVSPNPSNGGSSDASAVQSSSGSKVSSLSDSGSGSSEQEAGTGGSGGTSAGASAPLATTSVAPITTTIDHVQVIAGQSSVQIGTQVIGITGSARTQTVVQDGHSFTVDGSRIIAAGKTLSIPEAVAVATPTPVTVGSMIISIDSSQAVIGGTTFNIGPDSSPTTIVDHGTTISIGPGGVGFASQSTTVAYSPVSTVSADGFTFTVDASEAIISGTTYRIGSGATPTTIVIGGHTVSIGTNGVGMQSTTVHPYTASETMAVNTKGAVATASASADATTHTNAAANLIETLSLHLRVVLGVIVGLWIPLQLV